MMNRSSGNVSEAEARRRQFQNYQQDKKKHAEKEKEKLEKKKQEKWKRYEHIDTGVKLELPDVGQTEDEDFARAIQQSLHDEKVRENARLRAEKEKRRSECLQAGAAACSSTVSGLNQARSLGPRSSVGRVPFDLNSVGNSPSSASSSVSSPRSSVKRSSALVYEDNSANLPLPRSPKLPKVNASSSLATTQDESETEQMKQEMHRRKMQSVRENMQKLYSQNLNKDD